MKLDLFTTYLSRKQQFDIVPVKAQLPKSNLFSHLKKLPTIKEVNEMLISETLKRTHGNKSLAAQILGITRQTIAKYETPE